jgi:hypothetical protein
MDTNPTTEVDPVTGRPHNKYLERKFLIAILLPIVRIATKALGLDEHLGDFVEYAADIVTFGAPLLWMALESRLDQRKIEGQTQVTVQELKLKQAKVEASAEVNVAEAKNK